MSDDIAVGIDLGTSYSCVAAMQDGAPRVIANEWGERTHASVVSFLDDGTVLVGNDAKKNIITHAERTVYSAKRLIGRFFFSREVRKAVVTCPAYFNDNQRQATRDAARIAGLQVLRIINEPTAAALAYGFGRDINQKICVYDLGGGTFDVSILEIGKDVFEVLATAGDTYLGGDDFDDRIMTWLADDFLEGHGLDLRQNRFCLQMLKEASERAKIDVGREGVASIQVPGICQSPEGEVLNLARTLDADTFNKMVTDLVQRTFKVCDEALQSARFTAGDIDAVILVGGPTRLPVIRNSVRHYFQKEPMAGIDPDEVVALGASIQAAALLDKAAA